MQRREFYTLLITMIVGGLSYSIISFSYMHSTFTTKEQITAQEHRIDRVETRIEERLRTIESKIDRLIERRRGK